MADTDGPSPFWYKYSCADIYERNQERRSEGRIRLSRALVVTSPLLWENGTTISYSYLDGKWRGTVAQRYKVDIAIKEWEKYANIKFLKQDNQGAIRISFNPSTGSYSYVGKQALNAPASEPTMNLSWVERDSFSVTSEETGTILHEFGHALGLLHEHRSPAREGALTLKEEIIYPYYQRLLKWSREKIKKEILDVYNTSDISNYSRFDPTSVMMYYMPAEFNVEEIEVLPNTELSDLDKAYTVIYYPPSSSGANPLAPHWTLAHALVVAGVDEQTKQEILSASDVSEIRSLFEGWNQTQQQQYEAQEAVEDSTTLVAPAWFPKICADLDRYAETPPGNLTPGEIAHGVFQRSGLLWENRKEIAYSYLGGTSNQQAKVDGVIQEWERYANISFAKADSSSGDIRISFNPNLGSWSHVGRQALDVPGTEATMNLAHINPSTTTPDRWEEGTILHEFGHAIGLIHEHRSSTHGGNITLSTSELHEFYSRTQQWNESEVKELVWRYNNRGSRNQSEPDQNSVMRYFVPREVNERGTEVAPNFKLSEIDKAYVAIQYPFQTKDPLWALPRALDVVGVTGSAKAAILKEASADGVRSRFSIWNAARIAGSATKPNQGLSAGGPAHGAAEGRADGEDIDWAFVLGCASQTPLILGESDGEQDDGGAAHGVAVYDDVMWAPGDEIRYCFQQPNGDGAFTIRRERLERHMAEYRGIANIRFRRVEPDEDPDVKITFESPRSTYGLHPKRTYKGDPDAMSGMDSWCKFGKRGKRWVNTLYASTGGDINTSCFLNVPAFDPEPDSAEDDVASRICRHETGHMLGLIHEHTNPRTETTDPVEEESGVWTPFDPNSIMLYSRRVLKSGGQTKLNINFSETDRCFIRAMYPPNPNGIFSSGESKFREALEGLRIKLTEPIKKHYNAAFDKKIPPEDRRAAVALMRLTIQQELVRLPGAEPGGPFHGINEPTSEGEGGGNPRPQDWCATEKLGLSEEDGGDEGTAGVAHAAAGPGIYMWLPGQTIRYWFQQAEYDLPLDELPPRRKNRVECLEAAFRDWNRVCPAITFRRASEAEKKKEKSEVGVKVFFAEKSGVYWKQSQFSSSWTKLGTSLVRYKNLPSSEGGIERTNMYLVLTGGEDPKRDIRTCRHEVGHILGLMHEQASPLSLVKDEPASAPPPIWTKWDPKSIMLYAGLDYTSGPKRRTELNVEISEQDEAFARALYPMDPHMLERALGDLDIWPDLWGPVLRAYDEYFLVRSDGKARKREMITPARLELAKALQKSHGPKNYQPAEFDVGPGPANAPANAPKPSSDVNIGSTSTNNSPNFLSIITSSLKQFFNPGGNQTFALQFPGRFLQISQYAWDTGSAGVYGQFIKPVVVNESEFRLTDQLYDMTDVVSGSNGVSLSQVYDQIINNLLPKFKNNGLSEQQDQIRQWLLREVKTSAWVRDLIESQQTSSAGSTGDDDEGALTTSGGDGQASFGISNKLSDSGTVNRMELSNALMQEYLEAKQAWEVERDGMLEQALELKLGTRESATALNNLTRKLAHTTAAREAQLASKYADAVVRGYTHNVREYVGYLDVKSSAEALQDAKDALREAAMSSLDGSLKVYPVQMTPIDWFEGLSTSFQMEDLTQDPDLIYQQIRAKSQQLDTLNSQLAALRIARTGDPAELREAVEEAQKGLDDAQATLAQQYSSNVIAMAKTCFASDGELDEKQLEKLVDERQILGVALDQLVGDLKATSSAQKQLTSASRAYSQALASYALAEATDTQQQQERIRLQIQGLTGEIDELTARYTSLNKLGARPANKDKDPRNLPTVASIPLFPNASDTAGGSRWQQIQFDHELRSDYSKNQSKASASSTSMSVNLWFASASSSQSSSQAESSSITGSFSNSVSVGFRATLITVDRAGWFQPQFFKQSGSFYHIDSAVSWTESRDGSNALLPAFPVGYVVCKDITIKIHQYSSMTGSSQRNMREDAAASGGVLCFSYSQSSSSSQNENSYSFQACSDGCVIRIPGPQILGYILQKTDKDSTGDMPKQLPPGFFIPDAAYDSATGAGDGDNGPAHGADPNGGGTQTSPFLKEIDDILKEAKVSSRVMDSVHKALKKELESLSNDVAARVLKDAAQMSSPGQTGGPQWTLGPQAGAKQDGVSVTLDLIPVVGGWGITLKIGSASVSNVEVDTGSSDLWVHDALYTRASHVKSLPGEEFHPVYNDGTEITAPVFKDNVWLPDPADVDQPLIEAIQRFSAVPSAPHEFNHQGGLLGLGLPKGTRITTPKPTVGGNIITIAKNDDELLHAMFCIKPPASAQVPGWLDIGKVDPNHYDVATGITYCALKSQTHWVITCTRIIVGGRVIATDVPAHIDSGAQAIVGPRADIVNAYAGFAEAQVLTDGLYTIPAGIHFPPVSLEFGGRVWNIPQRSLTRQDGLDRIGCLSHLPGNSQVAGGIWVIGRPFLENVYSVFDFDQKRVGFAELRP